MIAGETMVCKKGSREASVFPKQSVDQHKTRSNLGVLGILGFFISPLRF